uniref:Uncharacterized protein n=1 Tax=Magallana gigas TaxID=29159 RepID=K1Q7S6_MAGGI
MKQDLIPWGQSSIHTDENDQRTLILRSLQNFEMDPLARVSEALYVGLCRYECIGTPTEVTIRRVSFDMDEVIKRPLQICSGTIYM